MPQAPDFSYHVFLSHNAQDKPRVRRLVPVSQLSTLNSQPPARDCALPATLRRCKVVDFREESEVAFAEVLATLRGTLLPKLLSGELTL